MHGNQNIGYDDDEISLPSTSQAGTPPINMEVPVERIYFNELVITRNRPTSVPYLSEEVRALADAEKFGGAAALMLNNTHIVTETIVRELLKEMLKINVNHTVKNDLSIDLAFNELFISNSNKEGDYLQFAKTINGFEHRNDGTMIADPSWVVIMASLSCIDERIVGITTTVHPINMGATHSSVQMLAIVLTPVKEKHTKSDIETGRNIAAVLCESEFRKNVHGKEITDELFRRHFLEITAKLQQIRKNDENIGKNKKKHDEVTFGRGIYYDWKRRFPHYLSDYKDAFGDKNSIKKTVMTILMMFFANLLSTMVFGMLNQIGTDRQINFTSGLIAQIIGGIGFAIFGGQQMIIVLTTSPLSIMIIVFYKMSSTMGYDFFQFYAWIGIFNTIFLCTYAFTGFSKIMEYSKRSIEETFELFVSVTFIVDAVKACIKSFNYYYHGEKCTDAVTSGDSCLKEESLLFLVLLLGTMALGLWLNGLTRTPYLNSISRKLLGDFALPVSVLFMSFVGSYIFKEVTIHSFVDTSWKNITINHSNIGDLPISGILLAAGLALPLSILFFMEQNIASSIVNSPANKLIKGTSYHWDLMIIALLNLVLSLFGLPWVHGALPHSPMHLSALATIEEHVDESHHITKRVVEVVETRVPAIVANILVGLCIFLMPYPLYYIPVPVLNGLFLYMAFRGLKHNQLFERLLLFITEQSAYPPNHYLKRVPQRKVHFFTLTQVVQLLMLCSLGFAPIPYVKMAFPFILILQLPFRHKILPKFIDKRFLNALDRAI